jgi:hypothetical protein
MPVARSCTLNPARCMTSFAVENVSIDAHVSQAVSQLHIARFVPKQQRPRRAHDVQLSHATISCDSDWRKKELTKYLLFQKQWIKSFRSATLFWYNASPNNTMLWYATLEGAFLGSFRAWQCKMEKSSRVSWALIEGINSRLRLVFWRYRKTCASSKYCCLHFSFCCYRAVSRGRFQFIGVLGLPLQSYI